MTSSIVWKTKDDILSRNQRVQWVVRFIFTLNLSFLSLQDMLIGAPHQLCKAGSLTSYMDGSVSEFPIKQQQQKILEFVI